jgi:hypothetical protein
MEILLLGLVDWKIKSISMPRSGLLIMKPARLLYFYERVNIEGEYEYAEGWLQKLNKCHGIKYLKICAEKSC